MLKALETGNKGSIHLQGMVGSLSAFVAAGLFKNKRDHYLFILPDKESAAYFQNDLQNLFERKPVFFLADSFRKPGQFDVVDVSGIHMRTETLDKLYHKTKEGVGELIVTYPEALIEKVLNQETFTEHCLEVKVGETLDPGFVNELLLEWEFERTDFIYEPGQFAIRGGIIDIYSFSEEYPYRIELFDDEVETIRSFDPESQLSVKQKDELMIIPDTQSHFLNSQRKLLPEILSPENTCIWIKDAPLTFHSFESLTEKLEAFAAVLKKQEGAPGNEFWEQCKNPFDLFAKSDELVQAIERFPVVEFGVKFHFPEKAKIAFNAAPQPSFNKNFELIAKALKANNEQDVTNIIFSESAKQIERFYHIFEDMNAGVHFHPVVKIINEGFTDKDLNIACLTDHQFFNRYHKFKLKKHFSKNRVMALKALRDLVPGDYVVHVDHGVGKFTGLMKMDVGGVTQECMRIAYKDNDQLFVGINSLHKVTKFVGKEGTAPKVNKLGSDAWEKLKKKTKKKVKDIAKELIALYAKRKAEKGFAFSPDSYLQDELEASFIYEDTPDQSRATQDVKKDMEEAHPMDRLVCGDVGFGKTEVAIRAAFKSVTDSKQVAVLVPTTILAYQHYNTLSERLQDFPCRVEYLNRFKTKAEQTATLKELAAGKIDIIVGTHRLLGKDVKFKNLGLLIIDEEQKFGVTHKERLRELKVNVDTLTLTATPIPRTLQFSLMGARDLSIINTPPPNRQPVQTELHTFNQDIIREAIDFEVQRGGQVFFIHNRIKDIEQVKQLISELCPHVRVAVAHGQMDGKELEKIFMGFVKGKYEVLLATSLIESGIDIANVNTIIINNAHYFGLSDLHQLRGRVGRSNTKAFCYLLAPPYTTLTSEARKRLVTIEEFSDLGSGFNIAMRDLDIRGAGNILGAEQSGFVSEIGLDMYHKILEEAITDLKETEFKELFAEDIMKNRKYVRECLIETEIEVLIPDNYVNNINERLSLYSRLDNARNEEELEQLEKEMLDRFGQLPEEVKELFSTIRLRWMSKELGFERIILKKSKLRCIFIQNQNSPFYESPLFTDILGYIQSKPERFNLKQTPNYLMLNIDHVKNISEAIRVLGEIQAAVSETESKVDSGSM